jgi:hypothetical protein
VLRLYYLRFKNYNRSVQSIKSDVENVTQYGPWKVVGIDEENKKNYWYTVKINSNEIRHFEELIWEIEDHPLNLDGRDAKAINCSHLIDFDKNPDIEELRIIKKKFFELFLVSDKGKVDELNWKKLINILIFYGSFWERQSPWYCWNFYFANWKKIIRNIDTQSTPFKNFFEEFKQKSLEEIYKETVVEFDVDKSTTDFNEQMKWYASKLQDKLWSQGYYIVFEHYNYPKRDSNFINTREILNTKGDFKGGNPQLLSNIM